MQGEKHSFDVLFVFLGICYQMVLVDGSGGDYGLLPFQNIGVERNKSSRGLLIIENNKLKKV